MADQISYMKPVGEGTALDFVWGMLRWFEPAIIRQSMTAEIQNLDTRPDIRRVADRCGVMQASAAPKVHGERIRSEVQFFVTSTPFDFRPTDLSRLAKCLCDAPYEAIFTESYYDDAIEAIRRGWHEDYYLSHEKYDFRRSIPLLEEAKKRMLAFVAGRKPNER